MVVNYSSITDEKSKSNSNRTGSSKENARGLTGVISSLGQSRVIQNISGVASEQAFAQERSPELIGQFNIDNVCVICLEEMDVESGEVYTIPICQHRFHETCVRQWKKEKATCPNCRGVMPEELGLTNEHIWLGNHQITINAQLPPEPTFFHIFSTIILTPFGIVYSLVIVLMFTMLALFVCLFFTFFVFAFMQWYAWIDGDDMSFCGRVCITVTSIVLLPFFLLSAFLLWFSFFVASFSNLVKFYKNVFTCKCRWSNAFSETCVPMLQSVQDGFQAFMRQTPERDPQYISY